MCHAVLSGTRLKRISAVLPTSLLRSRSSLVAITFSAKSWLSTGGVSTYSSIRAVLETNSIFCSRDSKTNAELGNGK